MTLKEEIKWLDSYIKKMVKAGSEVVVLRSIQTRLKRLDKKEPPSPFHSQAIGLYKEWLRSQSLPDIVDARGGNAMKDILKKLKEASNARTDEAALASFAAILKHWDKVGDYLAKKKSLTDINEKLLEIIDKIRNGATKQSSSNMEAVQVYDRLRNKYNYGDVKDGQMDT